LQEQELITTKDILDAANWSSEGTFQRFYCRELKKKIAPPLALQFYHLRHLQTIYETEASDV